MGSSKVRLSPEEKILVTNREWILTKHRVIDKVYMLFGDLSEQMKQYLMPAFSIEGFTAAQPAKISKGERYKDMPWVTLDYPRFFSKDDVLAIRTFFWWGNYFSITLHLKGKYLEVCRGKISAALGDGLLDGFYVSFEGDEFEFDLQSGAYVIKEPKMNLPPASLHASYFKISQKLSLEDMEGAGEGMLRLFGLYIDLLKT